MLTINRVWAMPSGNTFSIPPIREFVERNIRGCEVVVDPFANTCKYGTIRNDLNPEYGTEFCMDALEFLEGISEGTADAVLFDPPYSVRQASELYRSVGKEKLSGTVTNFKYWSRCKAAAARLLKPGGGRNDTICVKEVKSCDLFAETAMRP